MNTKTAQEDKVLPTYIVRLMSKDKGGYAAKIGVTFATNKGNQRMVWDVIPSSQELQDRTLVFVPYSDDPV